MIPPDAPASATASAPALRTSSALAEPARRVPALGDLGPEQREAARRHFTRSIFAALTPLAVGPGHPFPRPRSGTIGLAVLLRRADRRGGALEPRLAIVQIPAALPRVVPIASPQGAAFVLLEEVVADRAGALFPGHAVLETAAFRVAGRGRGSVRLELAAGASGALEAALASALQLGPRQVVRVAGPLAPADLPAADVRRRHAPPGEPAVPGPVLRAG